jgi:hypothetical protein
VGSLPSCVLHRRTERVRRRRKADVRVIGSARTIPQKDERIHRLRGCGMEGNCKTFSLRTSRSNAICSSLSKAKNFLQPVRVFPSQKSPGDKFATYSRFKSVQQKCVPLASGDIGTHRGEACPRADLRSTSRWPAAEMS